jgi:hypothetical protein
LWCRIGRQLWKWELQGACHLPLVSLTCSYLFVDVDTEIFVSCAVGFSDSSVSMYIKADSLFLRYSHACRLLRTIYSPETYPKYLRLLPACRPARLVPFHSLSKSSYVSAKPLSSLHLRSRNIHFQATMTTRIVERG